MKYLAAILIVVSLMISCEEAQAYSRTWMVDTTFTAAAGADTITFRPWSKTGIFTATAWTVKLTADDDTSTVRVDWHQLNGDTSGYTTLTVAANQAPELSGRLDSCTVYLPANHQTMRFRLAAAAGTDVPPDLGWAEIGDLPIDETDLDAYVDQRLSAFGDLVGYVHTLTSGSPTAIDSIAGATAKYHVPVCRVLIETDVKVYYNWTGASGDTNVVVMYVPANGSLVLDYVDFYRLKLARAGSDADVQVYLWRGGNERAAP